MIPTVYTGEPSVVSIRTTTLAWVFNHHCQNSIMNRNWTIISTIYDWLYKSTGREIYLPHRQRCWQLSSWVLMLLIWDQVLSLCQVSSTCNIQNYIKHTQYILFYYPPPTHHIPRLIGSNHIRLKLWPSSCPAWLQPDGQSQKKIMNRVSYSRIINDPIYKRPCSWSSAYDRLPTLPLPNCNQSMGASRPPLHKCRRDVD